MMNNNAVNASNPGVAIDKDKLAMLMEDNGYSSTRLANVLGVDRSSIANWRAGGNVNKRSFKQMLAIFECEEKDLVCVAKEEPPKKPAVVEKTNVSDIHSVIAESQNKKMEKLYKIIEDQNENISQLTAALTNAIDILNDISKRDTITLAAITMEAVDEEYRNWKKEIIRYANKVVSINHDFKSTNEVLNEAYTLLRKEYGVVWEQEQKEFYNINSRTATTTLELQYWIETTKPTYKNLLIAKLDSLCKRDTKKVR